MVGKGWGWNAKFTTELIQQQMDLGIHANVPTITYALFRGQVVGKRDQGRKTGVEQASN